MLILPKGRRAYVMKMTNEEIKVYLEYTKVLLAINKIKDAQIEEALTRAIDAFDDNKDKERHWLE